eukprot:520507_1
MGKSLSTKTDIDRHQMSETLCMLIIYGYIHDIEKQVRENNHHNNLIPEELIKQCLTFYFDPIAANMIFDEYGLNTSRMKIINDKQVECLYQSSIRFKYGMPILVRGNNKYNLRSISWEIIHTANVSFPNNRYFVGVVSNKNTDFSNIASQGLTDAYGISGLYSFVYIK